MDGFALLVGHLIGDYTLQNDWMSREKVNLYPGEEPYPGAVFIGCGPAPKREYPGPWTVDADPNDAEAFRAALAERNRRIEEWDESEEERVHAYRDRGDDVVYSERRRWLDAKRAYYRGHLACTVHCALYTSAVWSCSYWWMPWWGVALCFCVHWFVDRFQLARWWMTHVSGQKVFAEDRWGVILVDNTLHLETLLLIAWIVGRVQ
jgi:hypothetical protein